MDGSFTSNVLIFLVFYLFLTFLSNDFYRYFDRLREIFTKQSSYLFSLAYKVLDQNKANLDYIKNENMKSSNARRDFYIFLFISIALFSANVFVLSQFFGAVSGLDTSIFGAMSDFGFLQYSHMVAAVIILFEIGLGLLYFYFENQQEQDPEEANNASRLYTIALVVGVCILVEGFIWYQLSNILYEQGLLAMPIGLNPVVIEFLKGFLGFFGAAFTMGEYYYGYSISKAQNEIEASIIVKIISIIFFTFVSLWVFLGSGILYALHIIVRAIRLTLEFVIIPPKFILKKIRLIRE